MTDAAPPLGRWTPEPPCPSPRVLVVAPHPDDEVLGLGTTMRWLTGLRISVTVVACTDGEASHRWSTAIAPESLRARRAEERAAAFRALGIDPKVRRLGLPDGDLAEHRATLQEELEALASAGTTIVVPWEHDGHPDHRAAWAAGAGAAQRRGAALWRVPIWGKVRRDRPLSGRVARLQLSREAEAVKAAAVAAFTSQISPVGPGPLDGPVLHPAELARLLNGVEQVLW